MSYSDLYFQSHSRPSYLLVALALLAVLSGVSYYFFQNTPLTRASKQTIKQHEIVNMSPQQLGVFWEVQEADQGWIIYGESPSSLNQIALDERDIKGTKEKRKYHFALMKNIKPETIYYYRIISNNEMISGTDNEPFQVRTIPSTIPGSALSPAYGKVISDGGESVKDAFVLLTINNAYPLLARTTETGEWLIPLQYVVKKGAIDKIPVTEDTIVNIRIFTDTSMSSVKAMIAKTHPLPQSVILGTNYTFIGSDNVLSATNKRVTPTIDSGAEISVMYPKQNAVIPATKPLIKGKGIPGKEVQITIDMPSPLTQKARVDNDGDWTITVARAINPGRYTLTMTTQNQRNGNIKMERTFTILKSGERVLGESTPGGTITVTISPTRTASTMTATPSVRVTSPSPTLLAAEPTPTDILEYDNTPTPTPPPPVSGISMIPYMMAAVGLVLLGAGLVLFL